MPTKKPAPSPKRNQHTSTGQGIVRSHRWHPATYAAVRLAARLDKKSPGEFVRDVVEANLVRRKLLSDSAEAVRKRLERARAAALAKWERSAGRKATGRGIVRTLAAGRKAAAAPAAAGEVNS